MSDKEKPTHIVLGASGQVGTAVADALLKQGHSVKAVIRNPEEYGPLESKGAEVAIADFFDLNALKKAFKGGDTVFLLTPENPASEDIFGETEQILNNYREAIQDSEISKIVGLSSIGAQHSRGTGNLAMSHMLENIFEDLPLKTFFIRPAYYYSNWLMYAEGAAETGLLPTFFPANHHLPMASPEDVAGFVATVMTGEKDEQRVYELAGPETYSPEDVARIFGKLLNRKVEAQQIPPEQWQETLVGVGFSSHAAEQIINMTEAVIDGRAIPEKAEVKKLATTLEKYLEEKLQQTI